MQTTAVFRAVADFASVNRGVNKLQRDFAALQAQVGKTDSWDDFDASLKKATASQDELTKASKRLAPAERSAAKAAESHAKALQSERTHADAKVGSLDALAAALGRLGTAERAGATAAGDHATALSRESASASSASSAQRSHADAAGASASASDNASSSSNRLGDALDKVSQSARPAAQNTQQASASMRAFSAGASSATQSTSRASSSMRGFSSSARSASSAGSVLRTVLFGLGVPAVVAGVETLGGALAALIGGLIGVVGAAGPAVGGLAALLPILLSVAGAAGTVMLAFRGVGAALKAGGAADKAAGASAEASAKRRAAAAKQVEEAQYSLGQAVKAQARVQEAAARDVEAASRGVETANKRLVDANNAVIRAERDLHDARRQAIRDLQDLSEQVSDNALSVEGAEIALQRAQERQREVNADATASALDRREAAYAVASAEDRLSDARRQSTRDQAALNEAEARGVDGAPGVVAAQESVAAAQGAVADAERDRSDASRELDRAVRDGALAQQDAAEQVSRAQARLAEAIAATAVASDAGSAAAATYADAMAKLSPAGRDLVNLLRSLQPLIQELSHAAQEALFPGLISALKILAPMIRTVAIPAVQAFGAELGILAVDGANRLKSFEAELLAFGTGDGPALIGQLGRSFLNLAEILGVLGIAAVPLARWLAGLVELWTANTLATTRTATETGRLAQFFDKVRYTLALLGNILKNVGSILYSVFKGAAPLGRRLLESFRDLTKQTADFLKTAEGRNKLKEYFDALEPNIRLTLKLLGDITMAFAKMGASTGATAVLTALDRELGPALGRLASALAKVTEAIGPRLVTLFADLADALANILNAGGGDFFAAFVSVLAVFATVLREITEIPGIAKLAGWLLAIAGALKAIKLVGKITGLSAAAGGLSRMAGGAAATRAGETPAAGTRPATTFTQGVQRGASGQPTSGRPGGGASGAPSMMARGGAVVGAAGAAAVRRVRGQPPLGPDGGRGGPGTTAAPAGFAGYPPTARQRAGGAVRRVGSAVGGTGAMVAGSVGGSMAGAAIGQRVGGDTGAMVGSLAGSVAGAAAPQALVSAFTALGPLVDGAKTKLASMASTLSGAVAGAARASGAALMSAVSGAGRAVGALAGVAAAWLRTAAAAVLSGARQAAAWLLARGTAAAGLIASLAQAAVGYARLALAALASAAKQVAVAVAMGVVRGAVMAWTAAQWLLNLAMNANPIGILILIIAALVAAFIYAWQNSETFRNIILGAWEAIKGAFSAAWNFIKPVFDLLGAAISWIADHWKWFATVFLIMLGPVGIVIAAFLFFRDQLMAAFRAVGDFFVWVWQTLIMPVLRFFGDTAVYVWQSILRPAFNAIMAGFRAVGDFFGWVWNAIIRPVWDALGNFIMAIWRNVIKPAWDQMMGALNVLRGFFEATVNGIMGIWNRLIDILKYPINFLINVVWNNGLLRAWNKIAEWIPGLPRAQPLQALAAGGPVRGPGTGTSDDVLLRGSSGEFMIREKIASRVSSFLAALNAGQPEALRAAESVSKRSHFKALQSGKLVEGADHDTGGYSSAGFGGVKPHVARAGHFLKQKFGVGTVGGVGGRPGPSDHPSGHALDFMTYKDMGKGDRLSDYVVKNASHLAIKYIIWRQRINEGGGWKGMENRGSPTANHMDHPHVSFRGGPGGKDFSGEGAAFVNPIPGWIRSAIETMVNPIIDKMPKAPPEYAGIPRNFAGMTRDKALDMFLAKAQQSGGVVTGPGTDSVLSPLTPGEFVVSRPAVGRVGLAVLEAINSGRGTAGAAVAEPTWVRELKELSGTRPAIQVNINAASLFDPVEDMMASLLPELSRVLSEANVGDRVRAAVRDRAAPSDRSGGGDLVQAEDGSWVPRSFYDKPVTEPSQARLDYLAKQRSSGEVNVVMNVTNPEPEPASDTAARKLRTLALMGMFS